MKHYSVIFILVIAAMMLLFTGAFAQDTLTILTYDSFAVSSDLVEAFENENNVKLQFIEAGAGGEVIARAVLTKDDPIADVIIGFDFSQFGKVFANDILEAYDSPELANIPEIYQLDAESRALPFNFGEICINYDKKYFADHDLAVPASLDDLLKPEYKGLLVTQDPSASNTGIGFLIATIEQYGEDGFVDYWNELIRNGLVIGNSWSSTYYTNFSAASGSGEQPMVVSYTTSPAAEFIYSETGDAPTDSLTSDGMCYRSIEFCGILKNTKNPDLAKKFIDAFIGKEWQEDLPMQMFVYPVNEQAELPEEFELYGKPAVNPVMPDPERVAEKHDEWVRTWAEEVLVNY